MTGRRGNFVIVLVVVVVLGLLGRKVIEHDDDNEKTVKRIKEWGRREDENDNEHEDD